MNREKESSNKLTTKIRSSLAMKLNLRMLARLVLGFFIINMAILMMGFFFIFWNAEEGANNIAQGLKATDGNYELLHYTGNSYQVLVGGETPRAIRVPRNLQERLPLRIEGGQRSFEIPEALKSQSLLERIYSIKYIVGFPMGQLDYQIVYLLGLDFKLFLNIFIVILIIELLIIIVNVSRGYRSIRKTLQPIAELAATTRNLNAEISPLSDGRKLRDLAGAISNIDASRLDSNISVDSSQDELKDLALAINNMLDRINHSYQSQARFVSDASHELRTPISVIQGYANLLDRWGKNDEETLQESINAIKSEAENMKDLVEQLLFLARGDNETIHLSMEVFDICLVMDEVVKETHLIDKNHDFDLDLDRPAFINGDKQLVKQAIRILLDNSMKFTSQGEKIMLKIRIKDGGVHLVVQDSGIGIGADDLANIFDRFYRSDESRARKTGGSGLGLSIAKWIIDHHDADFEILSRVDIGTRVTIVFPEVKKIST